MDYAIRILLEKKLDIEVEMEKGDFDKINSLKKKYADVCVALNKLNLTHVSNSFWVVNDCDNSVLFAFNNKESAEVRMQRLIEKGHFGLAVNEMIVSG